MSISRPVLRKSGFAPLTALVRGGKRLCRDETGSAALEYAFIGPIYIAMLLGILHIALIYLGQEGLETAVENAARMVMTGQAQTMVITSGSTTYTGMSATDFKAAICNGLSGKDSSGNAVTYARDLPPFLTCDRLAVNVQVVPSGCSTPTITTPTYTYKNGAVSSTGSGYGTVNCAGTTNANNGLSSTQGDLVILQLSYLWPTISAPLGLNFVTQPNGNRLLLATYVFTVESYICADGTTTSC